MATRPETIRPHHGAERAGVECSYRGGLEIVTARALPNPTVIHHRLDLRVGLISPTPCDLEYARRARAQARRVRSPRAPSHRVLGRTPCWLSHRSRELQIASRHAVDSILSGAKRGGPPGWAVDLEVGARRPKGNPVGVSSLSGSRSRPYPRDKASIVTDESPPMLPRKPLQVFPSAFPEPAPAADVRPPPEWTPLSTTLCRGRDGLGRSSTGDPVGR